jgi:RsiW-degrading membrane proteinase PrsW (M82 family)
MDKIISYLVVSEQSRHALNDNIQHMIREGWQPLGGHSIYTTPGYAGEYQQTMVVYEEIP